MKFGISMGGSINDPIHPICKIRCILKKIAKKAPNLPQIGCFFVENGIVMGRKIFAFLGIAMGDFCESGRHIHVQILGENPRGFMHTKEKYECKNVLAHNPALTLCCYNFGIM